MMEKTAQPVHAGSNVRLRSIALPTEHGGWGFISEPILLGLLIAPTLLGFLLGITGFAAFLTRQPLKIFLKDALKRRIVPRTKVALRFVLIYGVIAVVTFVIVLLLAGNTLFLVPFALALPLLAVQLIYDARNQSRALIAELLGASATGSLGASIAILGGWGLLFSLALWLALAVKGITAVLYVRSRLRIERDQPAPVTQTLIAHAVAVLFLLLVSIAFDLPLTAPLAMLILTFRAALGLSQWRTSRPAKIIGFQEIGYGIMFVVLLAIGVWLQV